MHWRRVQDEVSFTAVHTFKFGPAADVTAMSWYRVLVAGQPMHSLQSDHWYVVQVVAGGGVNADSEHSCKNAGAQRSPSKHGAVRHGKQKQRPPEIYTFPGPVP